MTRRAGIRACGLGMGAHWVDIDSDGDLDLYLTNLGPNVLYVNRGNGVFEEARETGLEDPLFSVGAGFLDFDGDGDVDVLVANYLDSTPEWERAQPQFELRVPEDYVGQPSRLYRNEGKAKFRDVTAEAGLALPAAETKTLGVAVLDYDSDGRPGRLSRQRPDGEPALPQPRRRGVRGDDGGDGSRRARRSAPRRDGGRRRRSRRRRRPGPLRHQLRRRAEQLLPQRGRRSVRRRRGGQRGRAGRLFRSSGGGPTSPISTTTGGRTPTPWAATSRRDPCGCWAATRAAERPISKRETPSTGRRRSSCATGAAGSLPPGATPARSRRPAWRDGEARWRTSKETGTWISSSWTSPARPASSRTGSGSRRSWIAIEPVPGAERRTVLGTRVRVRVSGRSQLQEYQVTPSYASGSLTPLHFGLDRADRVESIEVRWPDGAAETFEGVPRAADLPRREGQGAQPAFSLRAKRGSSTRNSEPVSRPLSSEIFPPRTPAASRAIQSPRPRPATWPPGRTRSNRSNTRC